MKSFVKQYKILLIIIAVLLVAYLIYSICEINSINDEQNIEYKLFGESLFDFSSDETIKDISVQSGTNGEMYSFAEHGELYEAAQAIDHFSPKYINVLLPIEFGGWAYRIIVEYENGSWQSFQIGYGWIRVDKTVVTGKEDTFAQFIEKLE